MPRRFLLVRDRSHQLDNGRLRTALHKDVDSPSVDDIIEAQDQKLQEIKHSVLSEFGGPLKLQACPPVLMSTVGNLPTNYHTISTHYNNNKQLVVSGTDIDEGGDTEIDFSRAEDFLQLETPIDARKDHNTLKLAYTIPKRTFMSRLLRRYPVNKKRLAFIQRRSSNKIMDNVGGNLIVNTGGGDAKEVSITCQVCGQRFTRQHHFQRHIFIHPDPDNKKFLCQVCGKRFNRADHLNRHVMLHGDIKFQKCVLCGEEFDRASHLDRHRRKQHPPAGQQPSQTPPLTPQLRSPVAIAEIPTFNPDEFGANGGCTNVSGNNLELLAAVATPDGSVNNSTDKGHLDSTEFSNVYQPLSNIDFGTNVAEVEPQRPFPCDVCGRKFIRATHLRRHMRIHTGEKPFACHICGRRYARGDYLRAHIHAHRRDKIHKCKHCGEVFQDLTRFADHCRLIHKDTANEFGNPKPPPEFSPPPQQTPRVLESTFAAESAESITISSSPMWELNHRADIPITLLNIPEHLDGQQEVIIENYRNQHIPTHSEINTSDALNMSHLQPISTKAHQLVHQNGQLSIPDTANEVTILSQPPALTSKPSNNDFLDPVAQYIFNNSSVNTHSYSTPPHSSPVLEHILPYSQ